MVSALPALAQSADATWLATPTDGNYNSAANWDTASVPTGTAFFDQSTVAALSVAGTSVGGWTFNGGAPAYTFTNSGTLEFTGSGILADGGSATITNNASMAFQNGSSASSATDGSPTTIFNNSSLSFNSSSTAGSASITNSSNLFFNNSATAANATLVNSGSVSFADDSTAADANITNNVSSSVGFSGNSTAANAAIINNGSLSFIDSSTAGSASITNNASLSFSGNSTGGSATITNADGATTDFSGTTGTSADNKVTAGSIAGSGTFALGANELSVGGNDASTIVTGIVSGVGGSLVKTGAGTMTLSGSNTYSGGTTISAGAIDVTNNSAVGTGAVTLDGGTFVSGATGLNFTNAFAINTAGGTVDTGANTLTLSGTIADGNGSGALTKTGAGTLVLSGANSYSGQTTLSQGTLSLQNSQALGLSNLITQGGTTVDFGNGTTITNLIVLDGATTFNVNSGTATQANQVLETSAQTLEKTGGGTLIVNSLNNSGATTISAGTWQGGYLNAFSANSAHTVAAGATLDMGGWSQTVSSLSGAGTVTSSVAGDVTLFVGNFFTGNIGTEFSGSIQNGAGTVGLTVEGLAGSNPFILSGANTYTGDTLICDCSTLQIGNGGTTGSITSNVINNNLLIFNRSDTYQFDNTISDGLGHAGSVEQNGTGTLILTGTNTYSGTTTVNAGTLQVDGALTASATTVNSGGTLAGTGSVFDTTVNGGGFLMPGSLGTPGMLTVQGNLSFNSGATYLVQASSGAFSMVTVNGTATLSGTTTVNFASGAYAAGSYTILTATGGLNNTTFNALDTTGFENTTGISNPHLVYDANNVYLVLDPGTIALLAGLNGNQANVAGGINNAINGGANPTGPFATLLTFSGPQLTNALNQLSGQAATGAAAGGIGMMNSFLSLLLNPLGGAPGGNPGALGFARSFGPGEQMSAEAKDAYAAVTPKDRRAQTADDQRWALWGQGYGGYNTNGGNTVTGSTDVTTRTWGLAAGADYRASANTTLGFALAGGTMSWGLANSLGGGKSDVFQLGAYASQLFGPAYVSAALSYAWHDTTTDRTVTAVGTEQMTAAFHAQSFGGRLESGLRFDTPWLGVTPYAAAQAQQFVTPSYGETTVAGTGAFALNYDARTTYASRIELGAWFDKMIALEGGRELAIRTRAAYAHDHTSDNAMTAVFQSLPGSNFVVNGAAPPKDLLLVSAGGELRLTAGLTLGAKFDGEFAGDTQTYTGTGMVKYAW